ncbi:hypothetical protein T10_1960, partial [Trichinella papuae]
LVLPICFNLTNWKLPEMSFISVNKRCFIEENVDLSIVYARGRKPSLRQVLECLPIVLTVVMAAYVGKTADPLNASQYGIRDSRCHISKTFVFYFLLSRYVAII